MGRKLQRLDRYSGKYHTIILYLFHFNIILTQILFSDTTNARIINEQGKKPFLFYKISPFVTIIDYHAAG